MRCVLLLFGYACVQSGGGGSLGRGGFGSPGGVNPVNINVFIIVNNANCKKLYI